MPETGSAACWPELGDRSHLVKSIKIPSESSYELRATWNNVLLSSEPSSSCEDLPALGPSAPNTRTLESCGPDIFCTGARKRPSPSPILHLLGKDVAPKSSEVEGRKTLKKLLFYN